MITIEFKRDALLYDIENMAYVAHDSYGERTGLSLHQVADICREGNIDRVGRMLDLAFSRCASLLSPVLEHRKTKKRYTDRIHSPHGYKLYLKGEGLQPAAIIRIKETVHEYLVCRVIYDWLGITLPEGAEVWKRKIEELESRLTETSVYTRTLRRRLSPF